MQRVSTACRRSAFGRLRLSASPCTRQAPLSLGLSRKEYWSGLPCPPPGDLPDAGLKLVSLMFLHWQMGSLPLVLPAKPESAIGIHTSTPSKGSKSRETTSMVCSRQVWCAQDDKYGGRSWPPGLLSLKERLYRPLQLEEGMANHFGILALRTS